MSPATVELLIAAEADLAPGFVCFTTSRAFDPLPRTNWQQAGERLTTLFEESVYARPRIVFAGQVHGNTVEVVEREGEAVWRMPNCDGLVSRYSDVMLVIQTADCVPIVLVDETTGIFGAAHAGWKGTRQNIVSVLIDEMAALGAKRDSIKGWMGPSIGGFNYEVSEALAKEFESAFGHLGKFLNGRLLDLGQLIKLQAADAGLRKGALNHCGLCTFQDEHLFHSHRRQGELRGHQFTVCGYFHGKDTAE